MLVWNYILFIINQLVKLVCGKLKSHPLKFFLLGSFHIKSDQWSGWNIIKEVPTTNTTIAVPPSVHPINFNTFHQFYTTSFTPNWISGYKEEDYIARVVKGYLFLGEEGDHYTGMCIYIERKTFSDGPVRIYIYVLYI